MTYFLGILRRLSVPLLLYSNECTEIFRASYAGSVFPAWRSRPSVYDLMRNCRFQELQATYESEDGQIQHRIYREPRRVDQGNSEGRVQGSESGRFGQGEFL